MSPPTLACVQRGVWSNQPWLMPPLKQKIAHDLLFFHFVNVYRPVNGSKLALAGMKAPGEPMQTEHREPFGSACAMQRKTRPQGHRTSHDGPIVKGVSGVLSRAGFWFIICLGLHFGSKPNKPFSAPQYRPGMKVPYKKMRSPSSTLVRAWFALFNSSSGSITSPTRFHSRPFGSDSMVT